MQYNEYIINSIIANNQFGIIEVNDLETLKSGIFFREEYTEIEKLIQNKNTEAIKLLHDNKTGFREYLDIMIFKDQHQRKYIVTVYDNDELWQDPQVIEIYHF